MEGTLMEMERNTSYAENHTPTGGENKALLSINFVLGEGTSLQFLQEKNAWKLQCGGTNMVKNPEVSFL